MIEALVWEDTLTWWNLNHLYNLYHCLQEDGSSWKSVRGQVLSCVDCLLNYFLTHLHPENVQQQYNLPDTETLASHAIKRDVKTESCSCNDSSECKRLTKPADVDDILWQRFIEGFHKDLSINNLNFHKQEGVKLQSWLLLIDDNLYYSSMRYDYFKLSRKCKSLWPGLMYNLILSSVVIY